MKKLTAFLLTLAALTSLTACDQNPQDEANVATKGYASVLNVDATSSTSAREEYKDLQPFEVLPKDAYMLIENGEPIKLIDVREPSEYTEEHLANSILIPLGSLSESALKANGINSTDYIILYCRSGNRSARAYYILESLDYLAVNSIAGGITRWNADGLPVVK